MGGIFCWKVIPMVAVSKKQTQDGPKSAAHWNRRLYLPAYRFGEAARLADTTPQTLARWFRGYEAPGHRMKPVLPSDGHPLLSYLQLIEAAFVADFRKLGLKLDVLRRARAYCAKTLGSEYPFAELDFRTDGAHLFATIAEHEDESSAEQRLIVADVGGQVAWGAAIQERLDQFDYEQGLALRWYPRGRNSGILIDPRIAFGAPIIGDTGVPTWVIRDRYEAGEDLAEIEEDFGVPRVLLREALTFENVELPTAA